ncbi:MAG: F0F1 ATP synthase subunit gamma [Gammaproteobacteria bacterium]|nr:F0F1 ATP synthase subunit gamma [Gammaproteobacteria bacterium]NNM21362.1 F0F1 ATP synthase subunit gamma [Gammaproteobacteria bacterium]
MAVGKEIRTKIKSVKNTQKITKAMEMVAASKMRKTQNRMEMARPYAKRIQRVIAHISQANPDYKHPFLSEREAKRVGCIIITTDRGLCGGLNTGLFRRVLGDLREWEQQDIEVDLCMIGAKGVGFFRRLGLNIVAQTTHLGDRPHVADLIGTVKIMLDAYSEGRIDRLYLMFNDFINTMSQQPHVETLLPIEPIGADELQDHWDYIYEPGARELLDGVLMRYIEARVYRGALENIASEQAARMVAMKAATDNAGEIINQLQLVYNKARQAAITQEISEIVGGAAAV